MAASSQRSFAHLYDTGGLRRTHLRGHSNILKRLLIHAGAFNLGLLMRQVFGRGTPRGLQGRRIAPGAPDITLGTLLDRVWTAAMRLWYRPRPRRPSGPPRGLSCSPAKLRDFHHGLLTRYGAGSHPCPIGRPTPARSHERPTRLTSMPLERLPDLPRVVVPRIEGRDTLYEFDVSAAPSREWRAAFLWPPPG